MKNFFTQVLATMTGCLVSFILLVGIIVAVVMIMVALNTGSDNSIDSSSVLQVSLGDAMVDRGPEGPTVQPTFGAFGKKTMGLNSVLNAIQSAKSDKRIKGIFIDAGDVRAPFSMLEEIRAEILDFKKSGKFVYGYADDYSQAGYFLASVADSVFVSPTGTIGLKGFAMESMFFKGTLDKLGIRAEIFRHGKFKSAVEPFMDKRMSAENREQLETIVKSLWKFYAEQCARSRNIDPAVFDSAAEDLLLHTANDALALHLLDRIAYKEEVLKLLAVKSGLKNTSSPNLVGIRRYLHSSSYTPPWKKGPASSTIAVIYANGDIQTGGMRDNAIGSDTYAQVIREARLDKAVKAIVLRVNSPGGDALAADIIWREVVEARREKPVIVSMSEYAASGGYYISCGADSILTDVATLTGSIGVFSLLFDVRDLFDSKLGITFDVAKTHSHADFPSGTRPMTAAEGEYLQGEVDHIYDLFVTKVAEGRKIDRAVLDPLCNGRVWTGIDAVGIRLADRVGGLNEAIRSAAAAAKLREFTVSEMPAQRNFLDDLLSWFGDGVEMRALDDRLGKARFYFEGLKMLERLQGVQMRLPFHSRLIW